MVTSGGGDLVDEVASEPRLSRSGQAPTPPQFPTGQGNEWRQRGVSDDAPPGSATAMMRGGYEQHEEDPNLASNSLKYGLGSAAATAGTAVAPAATSGVGSFVAGQAAKHPLITKVLASTAIRQARRIPYVGEFIPPYAEMAPWLGLKGTAATAAAGEAEEQLAKPKLVEQIKQNTTAAEPYPAKPLNWPPEAPTSSIRVPAQSGYQALQEEGSLKDQIRNQVAGEDRMRLQRGPLGRSKGDLNADFDQAMGKPPAPVRYTKTPTLKTKVAAGTPQATTDEELLPALQESLKQAMKKKGNR